MLPIIKRTQGVVSHRQARAIDRRGTRYEAPIIEFAPSRARADGRKEPGTVSAWIKGGPMAPPYVDTIVRLVQALWEAGVLIECSPGPYGNVRDRRRRNGNNSGTPR
jgi:hypothetical protein